MMTVSSGVIALELVLVVLFGILPIIAAIYLLAKHTVKGSSFWAGLLAYFISIIIVAIASTPITIIMQKSSSDPSAIAQNKTYIVIVAIITAVILGFTELLCCAKIVNTKNFKNAISFGLGFSFLIALTAGFSNFSSYLSSCKINNGTFIKQYEPLINQGVFTTDIVMNMQKQFTDITFFDLITSLFTTIFSMVIIIAICLLISYELTKKRGFITFLCSTIIYGIMSSLTLFISNNYMSIGIYFIVAIISIFIIKHIKTVFIETNKNDVNNDSFIDTINTVKESENESPESNSTINSTIDNK